MMYWKGFGRKRSWLNFKVLFRHSPGGTEITTKIVSRSVSRDLNPGQSDYKVGVLTSRPRRSILLLGSKWELT
jgi:hypothetical protein